MPVAAVLAKAPAENFPVALRILPARYRRHLAAVYVFARTVDDIGDLAAPAERPRLLRELETDLRLLYATAGPHATAGPAAAAEPAEPRLAAVRGLADSVRECAIPMRPFADLIAANQQDQVVSRYQSFDDLTGYCELSANPVGRIVLHVFGAFSPERARLSDAICTGLQIAEHLQDVAEDFGNDRVYLPAQDMRRFGCDEHDLARPHASDRLRRLIAFEADRASVLIGSGAPLIGDLRGAARLAVAGYVAGGRAALAAIAAADFDVLTATPRPRTSRTVAEFASSYLRAR